MKATHIKIKDHRVKISAIKRYYPDSRIGKNILVITTSVTDSQGAEHELTFQEIRNIIKQLDETGEFFKIQEHRFRISSIVSYGTTNVPRLDRSYRIYVSTSIRKDVEAQFFNFEHESVRDKIIFDLDNLTGVA